MRKLRWANRVSVESDMGNAEIDCLPKYGGRWVVGEAKSGGNSYCNVAVNNRISRLRRVVQDRPSFVIAVPKDHQITRDGSDRYIERMGGRVLVFSATAQEIHEKASELYSGWNPAFNDRSTMSPHRNHANERTGR